MQAKQCKRQADHKRRLAEADQAAAMLVAQAQAKISAVRRKAGKMSSLARILQPYAKLHSPASPSI
jgi:hypothetical protein